MAVGPAQTSVVADKSLICPYRRVAALSGCHTSNSVQ